MDIILGYAIFFIAVLMLWVWFLVRMYRKMK